MELMEVVSPSVAVPVLCVLVCAFLVFAFGFKSPAQPPSFDVFEEDGKKRRSKKSKGSKSQSNGHAVTPQGEGNTNTNAKPSASPRQSAKQSTKPQSPAAKTKPTTQAAFNESQKKSKKQALKEEEVKPAIPKGVEEDADGWHTVPKKDKKAKKKDMESTRVEKQDSPVREEQLVAKSEPVVAASMEPVEVTPPASPQEQRNKKKKDKKTRKSKVEDVVEEQAVMEVVVEDKPIVKPKEPVVKPQEPVVKQQEPAVVEPVVEASIELQIKDAMETTVEETGAVDKRRNKKKKRTPVPEEDDFVLPTSALESVPVVNIESEVGASLPLSENTDALTVKVPKKEKKKKDRSKRMDEKPVETGDDGASSRVESSLSQPTVSDKLPNIGTSNSDKQVVAEAGSNEASAVGKGSGDSPAVEQAASFDEMGGLTESWTEAKPKSKKKKARRAD